MILLKEQFVALLFSVLCFTISILSGVVSGAELYAVCIRAVALALIGYVVGLICGIVIKNLFLEALINVQAKAKEKKSTTAATAQKAQRKE
ncbi:MAG: hypothetical protein JW938_05065 [Candidatus Omnitrophica bacterium]|nr:hypothetical protein [Candidatus Omnitrophota bacterium]